MTQTAFPLEHVIPRDVSEFCAERHLLPYLQTAIHLADKHFDPCRDLTLGIELDPETGERSVVIDVTVALDVAEVIKRKQAYTRDWIASASPGAREVIRLLYNIS